MAGNSLSEILNTRGALVLWLLSSVFVLLLLRQIDSIVHSELYNFGLQFSYVWAQPYWAILRLIYIFLLIPITYSAATLGLDFWKLLKGRTRGPASKPKREVVETVQPTQSSVLIVCNRCGKVFTKPMCILDFSGKNPRLINVCPYCNAKLEEAKNNNKELHVYTKFPESKEQEISKPS